MPIVEKTLLIEAPAELVYRVSQDYSVRYEWDPFPEKISVVSDPALALHVGTQILVRSKLGMQMVVEFVQLAPPNRAAIKMIKGPIFIAKFAGSWIFEPAGPGVTLARFRYSLSTRPRLLAWASDWLAVWYFSRTASARLAGLKRYCEAAALQEIK
jgi:hypothetical protein